MNFFKSSKYKLSGSSKNKKKQGTASAPEQFHKLENTSPVKTSKKTAAPPTPANDVTVCFKLSNVTPYPWQLEQGAESGIFPEEIAENGNKVVRIGAGQSEPITAKYVIQKNDQKFHVTLDVIKRDSKWLLKVHWGDFGPEAPWFQFKPDSTGSGDEIKLLTPDEDEISVELTYKAGEEF